MLNLKKQWDKAGVLNTLKYAGVSNAQSIKLLKVFSSHEWDLLRIQTKYLEKNLKFAYMARAVIGRYDEERFSRFSDLNETSPISSIGPLSVSQFLDHLILELEEKYRSNPYINGAAKTIYNEYCGYNFE